MLLLGLSQGGARSSSVQPRAATALDTLQVIYAPHVHVIYIYCLRHVEFIQASKMRFPVNIPRE